jgi:hypothetical protein
LPVLGCIQVSEVTKVLLSGHTFTPTGGIEIKGKVGTVLIAVTTDSKRYTVSHSLCHAGIEFVLAP